jgi:hypothetical protein
MFGQTHAGTRGRRRLQRTGVIAGSVLVLGSVYLLPASAVHKTGAFELDGDATNAAATPGDDWDNVCHQVLGTDCSTSSNTTNATAVSWTAEPNLNSTIFTGGGSKDPQDVSNWAWKDGAGGLPDKDNLLHSFAARYSLAPDAATCPSGSAATCDVLFFGSDRYDNSGDAQQGFWFFQNQVGLGTASSGGGFKFTGVHRNGDLLVISDFSNGGTTSTITVYRWNSAVSGNLELLETSDAAKCTSALPGDDAFCGIVNPGTITMPWSFTDKSGTPNNGALNGEFYEGGINLSLLGLSDECFSSVASETRSSTSTTATLKDFVLGQFANCNATLATNVGAGPYTPGTAIHDTATVTGSSAAHTPTGDVTFFLCATGATGACTTGGTNLGTGTLSGSGAVATASSPDVNTAASATGILAPGRYCFRAEWPGDVNYVGALAEFGGANGTNECFTISKIDTQTVTTPVDGSGATVSTVTKGSTVFDKAVVTGTSAGGDPTGTVSFFICGPLASGTCDGTTNVGTAVTGNPKTLVSDGNAATFTSSATSDGVTPTAVGRYCFRGEYSGSTVYNSSKDSATTECFTVTDSTSLVSAQTWVPNDSATLTSTNGSPLNGTLTITLYETNDCSGTAVAGQAYPFTLTNATSPATRLTTNSTYIVSTGKTVSWKVEFSPTNPNISGSSHCETSTVSITN